MNRRESYNGLCDFSLMTCTPVLILAQNRVQVGADERGALQHDGRDDRLLVLPDGGMIAALQCPSKP